MLYEQSDLYREKKLDRKRQQSEEDHENQNKIFTRDNTNRIVEKKKLEAFSRIFRLLDSDSDGTISA